MHGSNMLMLSGIPTIIYSIAELYDNSVLFWL